MDPRLNPRQAQVINRAPPRQDVNVQVKPQQPLLNPIAMATTEEVTPVAPPKPQPAAPPPQPSAPPPSQVTDPIKAELVNSIPVKQQGHTQPSQPVAPSPAHKADVVDGHDELDQILQAVNTRIKSPASAPNQTQQPKTKLKMPKLAIGAKPISVAVIAVVVAVALSAVAVIAYRQGKTSLANQPGKVGTTSTASDAVQSAGGVLVRPSDLDDYSQSLQTKLNSLNDSQDFDSSSLSDKLLGL